MKTNRTPLAGRAVTRLILAAVLSLGLGAPAWADYKAGYEAYKADDFATALSAWLPLANQDDALAQHALGIMYKQGRGVLQDDGEAAAWFRKAAEQGLAAGQYDLGRMYSVGRGVTRDDAQAVKWLRLAAEQGLGAAQVTLGVLYARGRGAPDDDARALAWIRKAAEQGDAEAAKRLVELDPGAAATSQPAAPATYRDLVTAVQLRLADLGLDPGPPDGVPGEKTVGAVKEFEKRAGLPATGEVSEDILMRLDTEAAARTTGDPAAPAPPGFAANGQAFGDWMIACAGGQQRQARRCFARQVQMIKSQAGGEAGKRRLIDARVGFLGPKGQAAFVAMLPLGVFIPAGAALRIDERQPIPLRLEFCTRMGCRAVTVLDDATLAALLGSTELAVRFSPGFTGKVASIRLSPKGLADAMKVLE